MGQSCSVPWVGHSDCFFPTQHLTTALCNTSERLHNLILQTTATTYLEEWLYLGLLLQLTLAQFLCYFAWVTIDASYKSMPELFIGCSIVEGFNDNGLATGVTSTKDDYDFATFHNLTHVSVNRQEKCSLVDWRLASMFLNFYWRHPTRFKLKKMRLVANWLIGSKINEFSCFPRTSSVSHNIVWRINTTCFLVRLRCNNANSSVIFNENVKWILSRWFFTGRLLIRPIGQCKTKTVLSNIWAHNKYGTLFKNTQIDLCTHRLWQICLSSRSIGSINKWQIFVNFAKNRRKIFTHNESIDCNKTIRTN